MIIKSFCYRQCEDDDSEDEDDDLQSVNNPSGDSISSLKVPYFIDVMPGLKLKPLKNASEYSTMDYEIFTLQKTLVLKLACFKALNFCV